MSGKKLYTAVLVFMLVIVLYGAVAMIGGTIAYRDRPRLDDTPSIQSVSAQMKRMPIAMEGRELYL